MVSGRYRASFGGFLGGDSSWQAVDADARAYIPLDASRRHRLAFWTYTSLVAAGVAPYFDLPTTVMDTYGRSARAYQDYVQHEVALDPDASIGDDSKLGGAR